MERKVETPSAAGAERRPLCQLQAGIRRREPYSAENLATYPVHLPPGSFRITSWDQLMPWAGVTATMITSTESVEA
jgi:hypothetical protein